MMRRLTALLALCWMSCAAQQVRVVQRPRLTAAQIAAHLPDKVTDGEGWATDVLAALDAQRRPADHETVCQVLAIIEQESGFQADPRVPGLSKLLRGELDKKVEKLGPLGRPALHELLSGTAPGSKRTFEERIPTLETERDLDVLFRDILHFYEEKFPAPYKAIDLIGALFDASPEAFNPVTTAGSMQVSVRFAQELAAREKKPVADVRDALYTRSGGVYFGAARLFAFQAAYPRPLYRFADYNAGFYASRNAALQEQLSQIVKQPLALDGDFLGYDKNAQPLSHDTKSLLAVLAFREQFAPELSERRVRSDLVKEKSAEFESTETFRAIKRVWARRHSADPAYARLPEVALKSPKLSQERSTAWFAKSVNGRYERCLERPKATRKASDD